MILGTIILLLVVAAAYFYFKGKTSAERPGGRTIDSSANSGLGQPDPEGTYSGVSIEN